MCSSYVHLTTDNGGVKAFGNGISCAKNTEGRNTDPEFWPRLTETVSNLFSGASLDFELLIQGLQHHREERRSDSAKLH